MKKLLIISYSIIIIGILCLGILSFLMSQNDQALVEKQEQRYHSYQLAEQLRQSSDDLTRMARTYVVTKNAQYEKMYWDILAIRNGKKPRPQYYDRIYWDLVLTYGDKPRADDEAIPLQALMKKAGFTEAEFAKLREAQNNSDGLVKTETIAMNAVKGLYDDGSGNYVKKGEPDLEMARRIMYDAQYHQHKAAIMKPIDEFFQLLDERTKAQVEYHVKRAHFLLVTIQIVVFLLAIISVVIGIFVSTRILKQVGGEPAKIAQITEQLACGQLDVEFESTGKKVTGIYAAVQVMVSNLKTVIKDIVQMSQGLAEGAKNVTPHAEYQGNFVQIKNALETAAVKLAEVTDKNAQQDWLKTGQTQLNEQVSGIEDLVSLAKNIVSFLTTYTGAQVGLFYLLKESHPTHSLKLIASYAYTASDRPTEFLVSEGLVGEAALARKTIFIIQKPDECHRIIRSGLTNALPHYVLILPILYENAVKGIIEIGSADVFTDYQRAFLEQVMPSIGIAVNTTESRTRLQELLQQSQKQSEELQAQQEELQQANEQLQTQQEELEQKQAELQLRNEELQSQSEELQSQSEELQTGQEELRQTNEELEVRTRELERQKQEIQHKNIALEQTQAEMEKAKAAIEAKAKELELASQYKSEFLANMSHELRTPLNSLLILAQLLTENTEGSLTEQQVKYAQTIHSAGTDLLTLINEILDLSKVEAGKIEVHVEEVLLHDLVETVEQKFRPIAEKKGLAFHVTMASDLPPVLNTDGLRLKQIINNLLSNAFKFTNDGEIRLTMQRPSSRDDISSMALEPAQTIAISVADTGIGIPDDKQVVIFEAFQQVDGTTSRRFGGTGLGLSISRQLARLLGGDIQLQSIEGKGSTFTLYLPETVAAETSTLDTTSSVPAQAVTNSPLIEKESQEKSSTDIEPLPCHAVPKERIADDRDILEPADKTLLIIEDDPNFLNILMRLAREKEFKCIIAEDGKTGLQLAEEYQPNAILLDVCLPQLDGWTVMERLKDNPDTRPIPVHFMSASDQAAEAKQMGAIGYLLKPISMTELGEAFKKIEEFITQTVKNLLVVVDNETRQQDILKIVGSEDIKATVVATLKRITQELQLAQFDCMIIDVEVGQQSGLKILEQLQHEDTLSQIPVIIYAERELTAAEDWILQQCANHLTIKSVRSPERLLDEATLFLHQLETQLSADKQQMLQKVHNKEAILSYKKVMIVDDDVRNAFALTTVLEGKNMEVIVGETGKEALELLDEHTDIAIVLMDIMMPEMDGYEAMREIRKQPQYQKLPIIALTAKAMKGDKTKCIEAGASDYLTKPVDTEKLISLMRVWLYR